MNLEPSQISDEVGEWRGDLLGQIQQKQANAFIRSERAELAATCGDYVAWMAYPPTPDDDPAEYEPYWARLTDVMTDDDERDTIVASWLDN